MKEKKNRGGWGKGPGPWGSATKQIIAGGRKNSEGQIGYRVKSRGKKLSPEMELIEQRRRKDKESAKKNWENAGERPTKMESRDNHKTEKERGKKGNTRCLGD